MQTISIDGIFDLSDILLNKNHKLIPITSNPKIANELIVFVFNGMLDQKVSSPKTPFGDPNMLPNKVR